MTREIKKEMAHEFMGMVKSIHQITTSIYEKNKYQFEIIFGHPLKLYWQWHGFDLERFVEDYALQVEGQSIRDVVLIRFGDDAAELIEKLIG